ncbi:competence protein ComK [Mesobacillus maritimus]|uniref:competence protein ComK n=1 Tax=Mesobacillus maritimus TaxID=1643336 RepID=UPI0020421C8E|nr:competence protein ComK [Mesobacillus maritimus]MCM3668114.1 competence protein ComK [Mesobacillus maritimus]
MFIYNHYLVNDHTYWMKKVMHKGVHYTLVMEKKRLFLIKKSPEELFEDTLGFYGYDFEGARKAASSFLGTTKTGVFIANPTNTVCFFPSKDELKTDCYFINTQQIDTLENLGVQTIVHFQNGRTLLLPLRTNHLKSKMDAANKWRNTILDRNLGLDYRPSLDKIEVEYCRETGIELMKEGDFE